MGRKQINGQAAAKLEAYSRKVSETWARHGAARDDPHQSADLRIIEDDDEGGVGVLERGKRGRSASRQWRRKFEEEEEREMEILREKQARSYISR